jgi:hypothetical protein
MVLANRHDARWPLTSTAALAGDRRPSVSSDQLPENEQTAPGSSNAEAVRIALPCTKHKSASRLPGAASRGVVEMRVSS